MSICDIEKQTVSIACECSCGDKHYRREPSCDSRFIESKTYGKPREIRCEKRVGHDGPHDRMTDMMIWTTWTSSEEVKRAGWCGAVSR